MNNWFLAAALFGWLLVYGVCVVFAAAQTELHTGNNRRVRTLLLKSLPYLVSIVPAFYWGQQNLFDVALFAVIFIVLTWILVLAVKKQWADINKEQEEKEKTKESKGLGSK